MATVKTVQALWQDALQRAITENVQPVALRGGSDQTPRWIISSLAEDYIVTRVPDAGSNWNHSYTCDCKAARCGRNVCKHRAAVAMLPGEAQYRAQIRASRDEANGVIASTSTPTPTVYATYTNVSSASDSHKYGIRTVHDGAGAKLFQVYDIGSGRALAECGTYPSALTEASRLNDEGFKLRFVK